MTNKPKGSEADSQTTTNSWRDRLNKELAAEGRKLAGASNGAFHKNIDNRFQKNKPGNTSRKTKKGMRAK